MKKLLFIAGLFFCISSLSAQRVKVLSYNIHHANPPEFSGKIDLEHIAKVILASGADLVGIQEVDVNVSRSNNVDQAMQLAKLTGMHYFFSKGIDLEAGEYGTLILSKHKIINTRRYDLPMVVKSENRTLAVVDVQLPSGQVVSFANTHLDLKEQNKLAQVNFINELGDLYNQPLIFVGDLNAKPNSEPIKVLTSFFARNTELNGPTYPNVNPREEIDYIMVAKHTPFKWIAYQVIDEPYASDHLPLFAELEFSSQ